MRIKDVKDYVMSSMKDLTKQNGFKSIKRDFSFVKKDSIGIGEIYFLYNTYGDSVELFPMVSIDLFKIRALCDKFGIKYNYSAYMNLYKLKKLVEEGYDPSINWRVTFIDLDYGIPIFEDNEDWSFVIEEVDSLLPYAFEYVKKNFNYEGIDTMYNSEPIIDPNPNCIDIHSHATVGLIAAKIVNNPSFETLKTQYLDLLYKDGMDEESICEYQQLADYLSSIENGKDL